MDGKGFDQRKRRMVAGSQTPVFTGERHELDYHGWLGLAGFGREKFTDGTLVAFDPETYSAGAQSDCTGVSRIQVQFGLPFRCGANRLQRLDLWVCLGFADNPVDSQETEHRRQLMGMFDEVLCNHELFGVHKGETHQTKDLHWLGGLLDKYEITPSGRLEFLEYAIEDRSDHSLKGLVRFSGMMTVVFTGGRRDLNYHGWLNLSCFGRAKFTDGMLVAFESEGERAAGNPGFESVRTLNQENQADPKLPDFTDQIEDKQD